VTENAEPISIAPPGILLVGHGSRDHAAVAEFLRVVDALRLRLPDEHIDFGFLELTEPSISDALDVMYERGCRSAIVLPGMLFAAAHVKQDIPDILTAFQTGHPDFEITFARELGVSDNLIEAAGDKLKQAIVASDATRRIAANRTLLLVVARGSNDPAALQNLEEILERLKSETGLPQAQACYANVATPLFKDALADALEQGYSRIIMLPWFLFTGIVMQRLYSGFDVARQTNPTIDFVEIDYFRDHPLIIETFVERFQELA
jgi:sirohydrochlorin cobaltochelatase